MAKKKSVKNSSKPNKDNDKILFAFLATFLSIIGFVNKKKHPKKEIKESETIKKVKKNTKIFVIAFIGLVIVLILIFGDSPSEAANKQRALTEQALKEDYVEVSLKDLYLTFSDESGLSELQKEEIYKTKYKGKIIETSIRADKINEASLSSQYVVLHVSGLTTCIAKAFFPSSSKNDLLNVNLGDEIIFTGKLINYDFGFASCLEFSDSKLIGVKQNAG